MNQAVKATLLKLWQETGRTRERIFEVTSNQVAWCYKRLVRRARLTDFRFHDLRHTFARCLANGGVDAFTLAALLGHSSLKMVARYTHPTDAGKRRAVEVLTKFRQKNVTARVVGIESKAGSL